MPIVIAEMGKYGTTMIATPIVDGVIAALRDNHIDALIIDPFVSCHHVTENDNVAIERVAKQWANIAEVTNTAIRYAHHSRKTGGEPVTGKSQRGASANYAAVRCVDTLNYMTEREANNVGMSPRRRKFYFRQDDESNLLPPAENSKWYEEISVDLGNAPYPEESDKIGVVVPWSYPQTNDVKTTPDEQARILAVLEQQEWWRAHPSAKDWVGVPIGSVLGIDTKSARGRKQVTTIVTDLVGKGLLIKTERTVRRKLVPVFIAKDCRSDLRGESPQHSRRSHFKGRAPPTVFAVRSATCTPARSCRGPERGP